MANKIIKLFISLVLLSLICSSIFFYLVWYECRTQIVKNHFDFSTSYSALEELISLIPDDTLQFKRNDIIRMFDVDTTSIISLPGGTYFYSKGNLKFEFDNNNNLVDIALRPGVVSEDYIKRYISHEGNRINTFNHYDNFIYLQTELIFQFTSGREIMFLSIPLIVITLIALVLYLFSELPKKSRKKMNIAFILNIIVIVLCFIFLFYHYYYFKITFERFLSYRGFVSPILLMSGFDYTLLFPVYLLNLFIINFLVVIWIYTRKRKLFISSNSVIRGG